VHRADNAAADNDNSVQLAEPSPMIADGRLSHDALSVNRAFVTDR